MRRNIATAALFTFGFLSQAQAQSFDCGSADGNHTVNVEYLENSLGRIVEANVSVVLKDKNYTVQFKDLLPARDLQLGDSLYNPDFFAQGRVIGGVYRVNLNFIQMTAEIIYRENASNNSERFINLLCK